MRRALSELLAGQPSTPSVVGIVDCVLRNADGTIAGHEHKHNLITDAFRIRMVDHGLNLSSCQLFINDNTEPMHRVRTSMRCTLPGVHGQSVTGSKDGPNRLWTFSTVFGVPPANRTFKTVGLCILSENTGYTNLTVGPIGIFCATVLGTAITQLSSQTLEVVYRLAFQRT